MMRLFINGLALLNIYVHCLWSKCGIKHLCPGSVLWHRYTLRKVLWTHTVYIIIDCCSIHLHRNWKSKGEAEGGEKSVWWWKFRERKEKNKRRWIETGKRYEWLKDVDRPAVLNSITPLCHRSGKFGISLFNFFFSFGTWCVPYVERKVDIITLIYRCLCHVFISYN